MEINVELLLILVLTVYTATVAGQVSIRVPADETSTVNEGSNLTIECVTSSSHGVTEWMFNGSSLAVTSQDTDVTRKYSMKSVSTGKSVRHYLTIRNMTVTDAGLYSCRQIYSARVSIHVDKLQGLHILEPLDRTMTYQVGDNFTFSCLADNNAIVTWYHNGNHVTPDTRDVTVNAESDVDHNRQTSLLTRVFVKHDVIGNYYCHDETGKLHDSENITVYVHGAADTQATGSCSRSTVDSLLLLVAYAITTSILTYNN